jgi:transposase
VVREFVERRFQETLSRSACLKYLHRLGFVLKRPKKRLLKADAAKRKAFVELYVALRQEAERTGAKIFFVDEAHFRADAVCLETGEVEEMEVEVTCTAETSAAFLRQLRAKHPEALIVIWDNRPAHHGEALRTFLATPDLRLRLVPLPGYRPDHDADEAIWDWIREEVTANTCLGTKAKVREKVGAFFQGLSSRTEEAKQRCRTLLQAHADALLASSSLLQQPTDHVGFTVALL